MKTKSIFFNIFILALALISFNACKKDDSSSNNKPPVVIEQTPGYHPQGLGSNPGQPYGISYTLPNDIRLIGAITSSPQKGIVNDKVAQLSDFTNFTPKADYVSYGSGTYVNLYVKLLNTSFQTKTLIIPAGLIFSCEDTSTQGGVIIQPDTIVIPGEDTVFCCLKSYCTNLHKSPPSNQVYKITVTTLHYDLWLVAYILKNKQTIQDSGTIQSIIWSITDGTGLSETDKNYLLSLP